MNNSKQHSQTKMKMLQVYTFLGTPPFYFTICAILLLFSLKLSFVYIIAVFATELLCAIIKLSTRTERPTPRKRVTLYDQYDASTFPSAHTARIASNVSILYAAYPNLYLAPIGIFIIFAVAYSRIALKEHYFADVIVGALVGILTSILIYWWLI